MSICNGNSSCSCTNCSGSSNSSISSSSRSHSGSSNNVRLGMISLNEIFIFSTNFTFYNLFHVSAFAASSNFLIHMFYCSDTFHNFHLSIYLALSCCIPNYSFRFNNDDVAASQPNHHYLILCLPYIHFCCCSEIGTIFNICVDVQWCSVYMLKGASPSSRRMKWIEEYYKWIIILCRLSLICSRRCHFTFGTLHIIIETSLL